MKSVYVQFGCGLSAPESWQNFDNSPTLRLQKNFILRLLVSSKRFPKWPSNIEVGDIVTGLPINSNSVQAIYCSHILEHLSLNDFRQALVNINQYLAPNGIFRLVVPDLEHYVRLYVQDMQSDASIKFLENTLLGQKSRTHGLEALLRSIFGNSHHLWMWDYKAIAKELEVAGFHNIRRAAYHDSVEMKFQEVEDYERWKDCLGVECTK